MITAIRSAASPVPPKGVKVTAFLDASEEVVEPFGARRVDSLEKAKSDAGPQLEATAQLFRSGATPAEKMRKGAIMVGINVAVPVIGGILGGPVGLAIGLAAGAALFVAGLGSQGIGEIESARLQRQELPDGDWRGTRTYAIAEDKTDGFDSKVIARDDTQAKPTSDDFANLLNSSLDPNRSNIVYLMGHGLGYRTSASLRVTDIASDLRQAEKKTGARTDVLVMESCLMGNMEAMNELKDVAKVAVVSEETLGVDALPVREMMADAARNGGTAQEIGKRMVELSSKHDGVSTIAAINLEKVAPFMQTINRLGTDLTVEVNNGHGAEVRAAIKSAMKYPQGSIEVLNRMLIHFSDLGNFLDTLSTEKLSANTVADAKAARQALDDVVIASCNADGYEKSSGLNFQNKPHTMIDNDPEMNRYDDLNLPDGWRGFMSALETSKS